MLKSIKSRVICKVDELICCIWHLHGWTSKANSCLFVVALIHEENLAMETNKPDLPDILKTQKRAKESSFGWQKAMSSL